MKKRSSTLQSQLLLRQRQKDLKFEASPGKSNSETVSKRKKKKKKQKGWGHDSSCKVFVLCAQSPWVQFPVPQNPNQQQQKF
jgi:cytoskeletal protein RodZ